MQRQEFLTRPLIFYRSYSRIVDGLRESWDQVCDRTLSGLKAIGNLTDEQAVLIDRLQREYKAITSGRFLWVGGTKWLEDPQNVYGAYNCSNTIIDDIHAIALQMALSMTGCGVGAMLEEQFISKLPKVTTKINLSVTPMSVNWIRGRRLERTTVERLPDRYLITVGDSRQGWVDAYEQFMLFAVNRIGRDDKVDVEVDLTYIRPKGETIEGFGGVANASKLPQLWERLAEILNGAIGRSLTAEEVCLLIDEGSVVVVAGNIRRSAGIKQFGSSSKLLKTDLWSQDTNGNWVIDPKKDALRMSNHTRVYHKKPDRDSCIEAVRSQYFSGEGAIQWAGEAVARANADILDDQRRFKKTFLELYDKDIAQAKAYLQSDMVLDPEMTGKSQEDCDRETSHRMERYGLNPCFAEGTMVLTRDGSFPIESLVGKTVEIFDGDLWRQIDNFRITAENQPVYKVVLHSGMEVTATEYHKFILEDGTRVQLKDLKQGDRLLNSLNTQEGGRKVDGAYLKGFLTGDGTQHKGKTMLKLYPPKLVCADRLICSQKEIGVRELVLSGQRERANLTDEYGLTQGSILKKLGHLQEDLLDWVTRNRWGFPIEVYSWDLDSKLEYVAGVMDADGCAMDTCNGFGYQISSIHEPWLKGFQLLLASVGIKSKMNPKRDGRMKDFEARGGVCEVKDCFRLTISQLASIKLSSLAKFSRLKSFSDRSTAYKLKDNSYVVKSVEFSRIAEKVYCCTVEGTHSFQLTNGLIVGQCGEILQVNNFCNLYEVHLNMIDPNDHDEQDEAFYAAGVGVAVLLRQSFPEERYQYSRKVDPIVGVSFTGLFDFFVNLLGVNWLKWWEAGRPEQWGDAVEGTYDFDANYTHLSEYYKDIEAAYLTDWRESATRGVYDYCDRNGIRRPNRCTTCQPAGSKSLLTNASPGWHPPKASRYIRRMTFARDHSIASAAIAYGYSVIPSQSDKDENGQLLNDPFDPRCTEWLVEVPIETSWANLEGAADIDISKFSALAQFDFYMQVQKHYTRHNTSATIELRESEIELVGDRVYQAIRDDEGYVSCAFLARFDDLQTFPRLPFEPIDKATYDRLVEAVLERRTVESFADALQLIDNTQTDSAKKQELSESGPAGCDSDKCLFPNVVVSG